MKKILIITRQQFGYHIDTYYYVKYLQNKYKIDVICWDHSLDKLSADKVNIKYVKQNDHKLYKNINLIINIILQIRKKKYDLIFIKYFIGCSLIKLICPNNKFILDIRTSSVSRRLLIRKLKNSLLRLEGEFFRYITIISDSLRTKLKISRKKSFILRLGADAISTPKKSYDKIHFLYVGTLFNRRIEDTIEGFKLLYNEIGDKINIVYTIIGDGPNNEIGVLKKNIKNYQLQNNIFIKGYIHHKNIRPYFNRANIGISYIPITEYFNCQPPTKTFEYLLSGMPVIATKTKENKNVINNYNGILIDDNPISFKRGLGKMIKNIHSFNSEYIRRKSDKYKWENIISKFDKYISRITKNLVDQEG